MAQYTIHVTEDDIRAGKRDDCEFCPVALAMQRALGGMVYVRSNSYDIKGGSFDVLPIGVQEKIHYFDACGLMKPFQFTISVNY
jgi:hypothetical protein